MAMRPARINTTCLGLLGLLAFALLASSITLTSATDPTASVVADKKKPDHITGPLHSGSASSSARLFSPSAELHDLIRQLTSQNLNGTGMLVPSALKKQLLGGLKFWGPPSGHFGHTGGLTIRVVKPKTGRKSLDMNLMLPQVHRESLVAQVIGNHVVVRGNLKVHGHHSAFQRAFMLPSGMPPSAVVALFHPKHQRLTIRFPGVELGPRLVRHENDDSGFSMWDDFIRQVTDTAEAPHLGPGELANALGRRPGRHQMRGGLRGGLLPGLAGLLGPALADLVDETFETMFDDVNRGPDSIHAAAPSSVPLTDFEHRPPPSYGSPHYWRIVEDEGDRRPTRLDIKLRYPSHLKQNGLPLLVKALGNEIHLFKTAETKSIKAEPFHMGMHKPVIRTDTVALPITHIKTPFELKHGQMPVKSRLEGQNHVISTFEVPRVPVHHVPIAGLKDEL